MRIWVISAISAVLVAVSPMTGCGVVSPPNPSAGSQPPATATTQSRTTAARDYSDLLIRPDAINVPGETYTPRPPTLNPHGIPGASTVFVNRPETRAIGVTVFVLATSAAATTSFSHAKEALGTVIDDANTQPAPVGADGITAAGHAPRGSKAVTVVMFTQGRTFVTLKFDAAPSYLAPTQLAVQVAQRQDALIKTTPL